MLGLFSDAGGTGPGSPRPKKRSPGKNMVAPTNVQQLSTSWEFLRPTLDYQSSEGDKDDEPQDVVAPPRFIEVQKGKISLGPPKQCDPAKEKEREILEARIAELEDSLIRLQERVEMNNHCIPSKLEEHLSGQIESMRQTLEAKERRTMQVYRDYKILQARFRRQESNVQVLKTENKTLQERICQYEHCLDDVMRKVVDAIVAEDNLREEVTVLKNRVRDLEAQNAALTGSPAKGRDEGYCTMSSGQPQPSTGHLDDLPEEPEQFLMLAAEPCSAEMEDWSMSQEELGAALEEDNNEADWIWTSADKINSTIDTQSEFISQLLQETIVYSDDEEVVCKDFTSDFYKLVNIKAESTRSLQSPVEETDSTSSDYGPADRLNSPTPSEGGRAAVISDCSSSDSGDPSSIAAPPTKTIERSTDKFLQNVLNSCQKPNVPMNGAPDIRSPTWLRSTGWRRVSSQETSNGRPSSLRKRPSRIPPPVPIRKSYAR